METNNREIANFNELIVENRNHAYGAYAIRKEHNNNVFRALLISCTFFCVVVLLSYLYSNFDKKLPDTLVTNEPPVIFDTREIIIPQPKVELPKPKIETAPKTETGNMQVVDDKVTTNAKSNDLLVVSKIDNPLGNDSVSTKSIDVPQNVAAIKKDDFERIVDVMPEFSNLQQFVASNLQYPSIAIEGGVSGTVYLSFIVEKDGSVSDVKVLKGIGFGCEQEAMRVVKQMPKWKPGKNHGEPVRVLFNLPVKFRLK